MSTWIAGKGTIPAITTNYDRLRTMSVEDLARELCVVETGVTTYSEQIYLHWLDWLKQEASDG